MKLSEFEFDLPRELIAQSPLHPRDSSRLMVVSKETVEDRRFSNLPDYLEDGDVLVVNDSKVVPARILGRKMTGGRVELLLIKMLREGVWECLVKGRVRKGTKLQFGEERALIWEKKNGRCLVIFHIKDFESFLKAHGSVPLPPYIKRQLEDPDDYQTVYANKEGSVAAPTAGLHFTNELIDALRKKGVAIVPVTLHVGPGTFLPIRTENIEEHRMEEEYVEVPSETAKAILEAKKKGKRLIAVGTTSLKALETASFHGGIQKYEGWSNLYIYPPFNFKSDTDALLTNFHLPRSTLLLLVSAFAGKDRTLFAYQRAIERGYRFYSFGDAMLVFR